MITTFVPSMIPKPLNNNNNGGAMSTWNVQLSRSMAQSSASASSPKWLWRDYNHNHNNNNNCAPCYVGQFDDAVEEPFVNNNNNDDENNANEQEQSKDTATRLVLASSFAAAVCQPHQPWILGVANAASSSCSTSSNSKKTIILPQTGNIPSSANEDDGNMTGQHDGDNADDDDFQQFDFISALTAAESMRGNHNKKSLRRVSTKHGVLSSCAHDQSTESGKNGQRSDLKKIVRQNRVLQLPSSPKPSKMSTALAASTAALQEDFTSTRTITNCSNHVAVETKAQDGNEAAGHRMMVEAALSQTTANILRMNNPKKRRRFRSLPLPRRPAGNSQQLDEDDEEEDHESDDDDDEEDDYITNNNNNNEENQANLHTSIASRKQHGSKAIKRSRLCREDDRDHQSGRSVGSADSSDRLTDSTYPKTESDMVASRTMESHWDDGDATTIPSSSSLACCGHSMIQEKDFPQTKSALMELCCQIRREHPCVCMMQKVHEFTTQFAGGLRTSSLCRRGLVRRIQEVRARPTTTDTARIGKQINDAQNDLDGHPSNEVVVARQQQQQQQQQQHQAQQDRSLLLLRPSDIVMGRGGQSNHHLGNVAFRTLIQQYRSMYHAAPKHLKLLLATDLCNFVRQNWQSRFVQKAHERSLLLHENMDCRNKEDGDVGWMECSDARAISKCSQALREGGSTTTTETTKSTKTTTSNNNKAPAALVGTTQDDPSGSSACFASV